MRVQKMGRPQGLLILKGYQAARDKAKVESDWRERFGGPDKAGQIEIIGAESATFVPLQTGSLFSDTFEARAKLRDMFIQLHGFSPEVFGVHDGSTRDSAYIALYHLAVGAVVPWLDTAPTAR